MVFQIQQSGNLARDAERAPRTRNGTPNADAPRDGTAHANDATHADAQHAEPANAPRGNTPNASDAVRRSVPLTIHRFLDYLRTGKSDNTVKLYGIGVTRFFTQSQCQDPTTVTVDDVIAFAVAMKNEAPPLASVTRETYLTAVVRFVRWCVLERIVAFDAVDTERLLKLVHDNRSKRSRLPKTPDDDHIAALLEATTYDAQAPHASPARAEQARLRQLRDVALIHALRSSGMRVGEIVKLTRGDLVKRNHSTRVIGKGNKERVVYFDATAWDAIEAYLRERKDGTLTRALGELPVFTRHSLPSAKKRLPLTTHQIQCIFAELSSRARLDAPLTPHALRHAFATRVLEITGDLSVVQDLLGHSSPVTTRIYAKVSSARLHAAHQQAFGK